MRIQILDEELYQDDSFRPAHEGDAGIDLRSRVARIAREGEVVKLPLGVCTHIGPGAYGMVGSRSSTLLKWGLLAQEGKVDQGYRGEVHLIALATRETVVERGDKVAQLIVVRIEDPDWQITFSLEESARGLDGFGSTGT